MSERERLFLYEEVMLLALRDERGTVATGFLDHAVAGAVLAELLLDGRIRIADDRKKHVELLDAAPFGDSVVDECLERMASAKRPASLNAWVSKLAGIKQLRHKVARRLCDRGILRATEDTVLLIFTRKVYPEIDPGPESAILDRLRDAIFTDRDEIDPRTVVLISIGDATGLLRENLGRKEIKARKKRIEQIVNGELLGRATKEVVEALQAAVTIAAIMPAITAGTTAATT